MRILLDYRPALRQRTGVGEYVHELARALRASSPPDEVLTLFSASWSDRLRPGTVDGVETLDRRIPVRILNRLWHAYEWPPIESLAGPEPVDVAQSAHPLLMPARRAAQVVTVHDLDFLDHPERTRAEIRRDYPRLASSHAQRADAVLAVSRHTAAEVVTRLDVPASQIFICSPGAPAWSRRTREPADGCVLFVGTLEPRKNVGLLLDAWERLLTRPGASLPRLVLAGRSHPGDASITARVGQAPLAGHVDLAGYVDPEHRADLYDRALMLVMPSHTEGFGIPALEAMTRGIPVIAANRGALPEVVADAGRLIDPGDAEALAMVLGELLSDRHQRDRLREAGWARAAAYQWSGTAERVRDAWRHARDRRNRRDG